MAADSNNPWVRYQERVDAVIEYIHQHLSEPLSSDTLAEVANLSTYHWHRIYRAITGESAAATVKRARLHKAAADLVRTDKPIEKIGADVGYGEIHSFSRTFKAFYGIAPGRFRMANTPPSGSDIKKAAVDRSAYPVSVVTMHDMHLVGHWHTGDFMDIGESFVKAMATCQMHGLLTEKTVTVGVYFADPDITSMNSLRSFAGVKISSRTPTPKGLEKIIYQGGKFASMTHLGPYALLNQSYYWLYGCWLPGSGEAVRDQPCCEIYLNNPIDTDPADLRTDVCLPVV